MSVMSCFRLGAVFAVALLTACSSVKTPDTPDYGEYSVVGKDVRFAQKTFEDIPFVADADWDNALTAFKISCSAMGQQPMWVDACSNAQFIVPGGAAEFFKTYFTPWRVLATVDNQPAETGLMTGYYEPMLRGSRTKHGPYQYPIYGVPDDLIVVDLTELHPQLKGLRLRGKVVGRKLIPYDKRATIDKRKDLQDKVLCWVNDPVEAFFLQIQGSGRVLLDDGTFMRVGYSDQNGHPYRALGGWLIRHAGLTRSEMSMQRIKRWVRENPSRRDELLNTNPNYVFFDERKGFSDEDGPLGAQGVPLTAGASVAVDRRYWKMGVPFVVDITQDNPEMAFTRPVIAQDSGGAIRGPIRFDYFWGYGDIAGSQAGRQKSTAKSWVLVPNGYRPQDVM